MTDLWSDAYTTRDGNLPAKIPRVRRSLTDCHQTAALADELEMDHA